MRHAGDEALERLADLLEALRAMDGLRETRPGAFAAGRTAFCHFHEDPSGLFVDVRLHQERSFERLEVSTAADRRRFLVAVRRALRARRATAAGALSQR